MMSEPTPPPLRVEFPGPLGARVQAAAEARGLAPAEFLASLLPPEAAEPAPDDWVASADAVELARQHGRHFAGPDALGRWLRVEVAPAGLLVRRRHGEVCRSDVLQALERFPPKRERRTNRPKRKGA